MKWLKDTWDITVATVGAGIHYAIQAVDILHVESYINVLVGIAVIIFAAIRSYYWIKHDGYSDEKK